ncbi:MAG: hypothetical protein KGY60_00975 [Bacteroidales bacterium]|nr:hypothetical protein [Bacteroidales bacterium]
MKHVAVHTLLFFLFLTNLSAQDSIRHLEVVSRYHYGWDEMNDLPP